jgi:AraC family transcriptional regulator
LLRLYREYKDLDEASPLTIEGLALEMLAEISSYRAKRTDRRPPQWLKQIKDYLHAHFSESPDLPTLSAIADVHPGHLVREFRKFYRCTIGEYIRRLRIEQACREMSLPDSSLAQIALSAGFSDQSHFSRIFKRQMGISPAEYRAIFQPR